jgi:hypothetical protein
MNCTFPDQINGQDTWATFLSDAHYLSNFRNDRTYYIFFHFLFDLSVKPEQKTKDVIKKPLTEQAVSKRQKLDSYPLTPSAKFSYISIKLF